MLKDKNSVIVPGLVGLLLVATFFVGRLSAQVGSAKNGEAKGGSPSVSPTVAESKISLANLKKMAKDLGMDTGRFNKCLDDGAMADKVAEQNKEGQDLGVSGTPSFFINGIMIVGSQPKESFEKIVDAELKDGSGVAASSALEGEKVTRKKLATVGTGYVKGGQSAKVKIVEYTDFECPYCNRAFPTIEGLLTKYGENVSLEYRSFPLSFHANAQKAAEAALCAGEQGKFWEMHDKMFTVMSGK